MERCSEVIGLPVICVDDGKSIGTIKDVIFCPEEKEVKAFLLERKGCQLGKKAVLLKEVVNLGRDAVVVSNCSCAVDLKQLEKSGELGQKGELRGLRIYTRAGEELGTVKDVLFDYITGKIEGVEVSDGLLQDVVQGRRILPLFGRVEFSEENILVDRESTDEMMGTGGGLRRFLE